MKIPGFITTRVIGWTAVTLLLGMLTATGAAAYFRTNLVSAVKRADTAESSLKNERSNWGEQKTQLLQTAADLSKEVERLRTLSEVDSKRITASLAREQSLATALGVSDRQVKELLRADKNVDASRWAIALVPPSVLDDSLRSAVDAARASLRADRHEDGAAGHPDADAASVFYQSASLF